MSYGVVNFDHLGYAILTIFNVLTIYGWSNIMQNVRNYIFYLLEFKKDIIG